MADTNRVSTRNVSYTLVAMSFASTGVVKHRKVVMVIVMVIFVYRTIFGIVLIKRLVVIVIVKFVMHVS